MPSRIFDDLLSYLHLPLGSYYMRIKFWFTVLISKCKKDYARDKGCLKYNANIQTCQLNLWYKQLIWRNSKWKHDKIILRLTNRLGKHFMHYLTIVPCQVLSSIRVCNLSSTTGRNVCVLIQVGTWLSFLWKHTI